MIKCSSLFQSLQSHIKTQDVTDCSSIQFLLSLHHSLSLHRRWTITAQFLMLSCSTNPISSHRLLTCCHKAAIWTSALHTSITQSAAFISFQSNKPLSWHPPKKICFCGINLPLELVLWSRTQNLGELHKYAQKAEHVAELWGGKDSTVDPRWQLEIWLTLETHGNNGGWSAF